MSLSATVTDTNKNFVEHEELRMRMALQSFSEGILKDAREIAPELTGALKASGRIIVKDKNTVAVAFGGGIVPYARLRHYVNHKNPQTLYYLQRAGEARTAEGLERYV